MELVRLNKYLKDMGYCSRRKADEFITKGYVKVNGNVITELGYRINSSVDKVEVSQELTDEISNFRYIVLHKPKGYVCTKDKSVENNIFELLPDIPGLTYSGRLDKDMQGMVMLSNDGIFVRKVLDINMPNKISDGNLAVGSWRDLTGDELFLLKGE